MINFSTVIVTVLSKVQNLKANHNRAVNDLLNYYIVTVLSKVQNLKANHNKARNELFLG